MAEWWYRRAPWSRLTYGQLIVGFPLSGAAFMFVLTADIETIRIFGGAFVFFKVFDWAESFVRTQKPRKIS